MKEIQFCEASVPECRKLSSNVMRAVGQALVEEMRSGGNLSVAENWCMAIEIAMDACPEKVLPHDVWYQSPSPSSDGMWAVVRQVFHWNSSEELLQTAKTKMLNLCEGKKVPLTVSVPFSSTGPSCDDPYVRGEARVCFEGEVLRGGDASDVIIDIIYAAIDIIQAEGADRGYVRDCYVDTLKVVDWPVWYQFDDDDESRFENI